MREVDQLEFSPPPRRPGGKAESPTLPLPPPRDAAELDGFLESLSAVTVGDTESIRAMFAGFAGRQELAQVFHHALAARPCGDVGRFMLLLSCTGELADPSSLELLHDLAWTRDEELLPTEHAHHKPDSDAYRSMFSASGMIQARAAEMFAWVAKGRDDQRLLRMVAEHPSVVVRLAAADACLFAHKDAPDALQRILAAARPEDRAGIGVPRLVRGGDRAAFDRAVGKCHEHAPVPPPTRTAIPERGHERQKREEK